MLKAYRVRVCDAEAIVAAGRRRMAIAFTLRDPDQPDYFHSWKRVRAVRAPEYDPWAARQRCVARCVGEECVKREMAALRVA